MVMVMCWKYLKSSSPPLPSTTCTLVRWFTSAMRIWLLIHNGWTRMREPFARTETFFWSWRTKCCSPRTNRWICANINCSIFIFSIIAVHIAWIGRHWTTWKPIRCTMCSFRRVILRCRNKSHPRLQGKRKALKLKYALVTFTYIVYVVVVFRSETHTNAEQELAISNILNKVSFPLPFMLFGPPGIISISDNFIQIVIIFLALLFRFRYRKNANTHRSHPANCSEYQGEGTDLLVIELGLRWNRVAFAR